MEVKKFEDFIVWQRSMDLAVKTYKTLKGNKDYRFCSQIQSAVVLISNNIAEGYERKTNNEFRYFLFVSKGSTGEYRSMLYLALKLNYISEDNFLIFHKQATEISRMLYGLIYKLRK